MFIFINSVCQVYILNSPIQNLQYIKQSKQMEKERISFPKDKVIAGARAQLDREVKEFTFQVPSYNKKTDFGERLVNIKKEYVIILKEKSDKQILQQQDYPSEMSEYLRRLSAVVELERFITQCEQSSTDASAMVPLKRDDAVAYGLAKPLARKIGSIQDDGNSGKEAAPVLLDDSIMNYKYLYDSMMPDCFEKSLKKLRCLLRFYIMLITPQTPLMNETWKAMRDMDLVQTEEELLDKIKVALIEVQKSCKDTKQTDQTIISSIDKAAQRITECNTKIDQDRASAAQNKSMIEAHKLNAAFKFLNGFLDKLAQFNFQQFFFLLRASDFQLPNFEKISSLIMPLGKTGVGKSTTIQLLTGAKMVTMDGHIQADPEEIETNPVLKNIVSAKSTQSVTRYCQQIMIKHGQDVIGILDTPGRGDTKCAEVEMSNSISIVRVIKNCKKPIFPILLFSSKDAGARLQHLKGDIINYSNVIKNIEQNINGFSYYFTQFPEAVNNQETLQNVLTTLRDDLELDQDLEYTVLENVQFIATDMVQKANSDKVIALDPLRPGLQEKMIKDILSTGGVDPTSSDFLTINADKQSIDKLNSQIQWHQSSIAECIKDGDAVMAIYKLKELQKVQEEFSKQAGGSFFSNYANLLETTFKYFIDKMKKKVQQCLDEIKTGLSRFNILQDSSIKNFQVTLQQLRNIDMIKDGGFSQYIRVDTSKELVEKVSQEVNDVVKGLKNVNIGDIQWIHFLEKILKLAHHFPAEFEALKNAALKQYQDCAVQVINDFNSVFSADNFLDTFKKPKRGQPGSLPGLQRSLSLETSNIGNRTRRPTMGRQTRDLFDFGNANIVNKQPAQRAQEKQNVIATLLARKFLKGSGLQETPSQIFEKCIQNLANAKKNVKEQQSINPANFEYFKRIENDVDRLIEVINGYLQEDIDEKICSNLVSLFEYDSKNSRNLGNQQTLGFKSDEDVSFLQGSLDLIESFKNIAEKHELSKIKDGLDDVFNSVIEDSMKLYKLHSDAITKQLLTISSESEILDSSHFKWRFQQLSYLRQVHQVNAKTNQEFQTLQTEIQQQVQAHQTKIRRHLLRLQKGAESLHESVEEDLMFEELDQSAQVIRYFGSLLDPEFDTISYIKDQLKKELEKIIKNFDTQASVKSVSHPSKWKNIELVGHMFEEYRHIMRVVNALEIQISQEGGITARITTEVGEALKVIQDALEKHTFFMTTKDYTEFSKYFIYLKLAIKNQEVYLPTPELLALAIKLQKYVQDSVLKQYIQLKQVFNFRYQRYLLKDGKDPQYVLAARPAPIFYKVEEEQKKDKDNDAQEESDTQIWEVPEDDDWQIRQKVACQEIVKVAQVVDFLLVRQLNGSLSNDQLPISQLLRPLLEKENLWDLLGHIRKTLLSDYFEGLKLQELWLTHQSEKTDSLFHFRLQALTALRIVDMSINLKDYIELVSKAEEEDDHSPSSTFRDLEDQQMAIRTLENEDLIYQSIEEAYRAFQDQTKIDPNEKINELKKLYNNRLYADLVSRLSKDDKIDFIIEALSKYIQEDLEQTLAKLQQDISDFNDARAAKVAGVHTTAQSDDSGDQDGNNLENLIKVICKDIQRVDLTTEVLGDYMKKAENIQKLQEVIGIIRNTFLDIFGQIKTLGESDISSAVVNLFQIQQLIIRIQRQSREVGQQSQFAPQQSQNSLLTLSQELLATAANFKSALEELVKSFIQQCEEADLQTGFSETTLYPKAFFDPLAEVPTQAKGAKITNDVAKHVEEMIKKFSEILQGVKPAEAKTEEDLAKLLSLLGPLRQSALCQAKYVASDAVLKIDTLIGQIGKRREEITVLVGKKILIDAFLQDTPRDIAAILDDKDIKPLIKDDILIQVQQKFSEKISGLVKDAVTKFGNDQTQPNLKELIEIDIPFIQSFFDHASFQNKQNPELAYILPGSPQQFKSQILDQLSSLACQAILYVEKQILAPKEIPDRFDKDLVKARENLIVQIGSFDQALSLLSDIRSAKTSLKFDAITQRFASFYTTATQWITTTVQKWLQALDTKNSQGMVGVVDDLGKNELNFRKPKFIEAFQADRETDANYAFVRALKNEFQAESNKERLIQWGISQKEQIESLNFKDKNKKSNKHERTTFYNSVELIYTDLASVAKKTDVYDYFTFKGQSLSKVQRETLQVIRAKVDELCNLLKASLSQFEGQQTLNVLGQKAAEAYNPIFLTMNESYNNLENLRDTLSILDRQKKEEINQTLQLFRDKLFQSETTEGRVAWLKKRATELNQATPNPIKTDELKEVAKILLEIQIMKKSFLKFKDDLQENQDKILDEYDRIQLQKRNKLRLDNLRKLIQGQDQGSSLIAECKAFEGDNMKELAKKLATKSVGDVLQQMTGEDIILQNDVVSKKDNLVDSDAKGKQLLKTMFDQFNQRYQDLIKKETVAHFDSQGNIIPISPQNLISAIKSFQLNKRKWLDSDIKKLPELLALIFGLWSLQKPQHLTQNQQNMRNIGPGVADEENKDDDLLSYLNQPHPAQILGILRILGVGYNPDEVMEFGPEERWKSSIFGNSPGALQARIRNNLVQIKTGEGKSVTLAVLSIIFALCDFDVRCACYSVYLSKRDYNAFSGMFSQLELKDRIQYSTFNEICEMEINRNGELRDIVLNLILETPETTITVKREASPRPQVLLIDEVDVFFSDDFFGKVYQPQAQIKGAAISALTDYMWENRDRPMTIQEVEATDEYKDACQLYKPDYQFLLQEAVKQMIIDVKGIESYQMGKLMDGKIQYKVGDSWTDKASDGYKTLFAYYFYFHRDASNPGRESIKLDTLNTRKAIGVNCAKFSYAEGPLSFSLILGLTGTLDTLSAEQLKIMKSVYNLVSKTFAPSAYDIPPHLKRPEDMIQGLVEEILIMNQAQEAMHAGQSNTNEIQYVNEMNIKVLDSKEAWFQFIAGRIGEGLKTKNTMQTDCERAVIVFFSNDVILKEFKESAHFSPYDGSKADTLTEKNDNDEKTSKVSNATNQGHVTLLTREFGRGTDFKYQGDLVINAGGLLVIQTFFTNDYSEEIQIRGRTRRQGTTGSYELIVQLEDLYTCLEKEQVSGILGANQSPEARYKALHSKRQELFEKAQNSKLKTRNDLKPIHYEYAQHVENIKRTLEQQKVTDEEKAGIAKMLWELNYCKNYEIMVPTLKLVKALVLIDATGSMGDLLTNAKNSIKLYFETVCKSLIAANYSTKIFKLQMAFYRNYRSGMQILEHSEWAGPDDIEALNQFLEGVVASGGQGCEAVEIGLLHANREIYEPADKVPVSLIYVIGDAPANANLDIVNMKKKFNNSKTNAIDDSPQFMSDNDAKKLFAVHQAWGEVEKRAFGSSTTWDEQLKRIKNFESDGAKIPIYSFYLKSQLFEKKINQVEAFFTKIRINNEPEDDGGLLDVEDKLKLAELFCKYTMRMIAKKNPNAGDRLKLLDAASNLSFT